MNENDIHQIVAKKVSIQSLIEVDRNQVGLKMVICPFHEDTNPSAKFFNDKDGVTRLYCFGCGKQYDSYHYLKLNGLNPKDYIDTEDSKKFLGEELNSSPISYNILDGFLNNEFDINEFLKRILKL